MQLGDHVTFEELEREQVRLLRNEGLNYKEIAAVSGRCSKTIGQIAGELETVYLSPQTPQPPAPTPTSDLPLPGA